METPTEYCVFWIQHWATCMAKGEWASWFQAVGSAAAIGAAGRVTVRQANRARVDEANRRRLQRVERVQAVVAVLTHADACLELFRRCMQDGDLVAWNSLADEIDTVRQTLQGMPLFEIPGSSLLHRLAIIDQNLRAIKTVFLAQKPFDRDVVVTAGTTATKWQTRMDETVAWCKSELLQLMTTDEKRAAIDRGAL